MYTSKRVHGDQFFPLNLKRFDLVIFRETIHTKLVACCVGIRERVIGIVNYIEIDQTVTVADRCALERLKVKNTVHIGILFGKRCYGGGYKRYVFSDLV